MKKLGKIIINPDKVIKNEELVNLRGGYTAGDKNVSCSCYGTDITFEYSDCTCNSEQEKRNIRDNCMTGGTCTCIPCA